MPTPTRMIRVADPSVGRPPMPDAAPPTLVSDAPLVRPPTTAPVHFPGYEILGELGRGGMGVVYRARQRSLNRLVALKVILAGPHASSADKARFRLEAEAAAGLQHPNIVQVYDVGEHAGFAYIAFELVEGLTLRQHQDGVPLVPREAGRLAAIIARAVQTAHEAGIVHRDLKPANILLAGCGSSEPGAKTESKAASATRSALGSDSRPLAPSPKVTDFGLAKSMHGGADLTLTGVACGTPNYMAPELVKSGGKALSPAVDVYGLGAVLYEMLTGKPPFAGADGAEVMRQIVRSDPPAVRRVRPDVPRDLAVVVGKCLEKEPTRRYPSAAALADDLDRYLTGRPILARPVGAAGQARRWAGRNPIPAAFLLVTTLGFAVTGSLAAALFTANADERSARTAAQADRQAALDAQARLADALTKTEAARVTADAERGNALRLQGEAQKEAHRAADALAEAQRHLTRADANLTMARTLMHQSLDAVTRLDRFKDAEFQAVRGRVLAATREFVTGFADQVGSDPAALADLHKFYLVMGYLEFVNENHGQASAEYATAVAVGFKWVEIAPDDASAVLSTAFASVQAGNALVNAGKPAEAVTRFRDAATMLDGVLDRPDAKVEWYKQAQAADAALVNYLARIKAPAADRTVAADRWVAHGRALVARTGDEPESAMRLADALLHLGLALDAAGRAADAEAAFAEAEAARRRLMARPGGGTDQQVEVARVLLALARHHRGVAGRDRCEAAYRDAVATFTEVCRRAPDHAGFVVERARARAEFADFLRGVRRFEEAEAELDAVIAETDALARRTPVVAHAREVWAVAAVARGHLYNATHRHREAAAEWAKLADQNPDPAARNGHRIFVVQSLSFTGDWKAAAEAAGPLADRGDFRPEDWCDLGRAWLYVYQAVGADHALDPADQQSAGKKARAAAVACLEKAKAGGLFRRPPMLKMIETHPDFAPVRGRFDPRD